MVDEYQRYIRKLDLAILVVMSLGVLAIAVVTAPDRSEPARKVVLSGH